MVITQNGVLQKDDNDYPVMGGTSSSDNATIINSAFDPVTRRLLTDGGGSGGGLEVGVTTITGGTDTRILYDNAGVLGEYAIGTGVATALSNNVNSTGGIATYPVSGAGVVLTVGTTTIASGTDTRVFFQDGASPTGVFQQDSGFSYNKTNKALTIGGATVTASAPIIDASQTWNNGATTFTGLKLNITNTASAAASKVFDFQVGGTSFLNLSIGGTLNSRHIVPITDALYDLGENGVSRFRNAWLSQAISVGGTNTIYGTTNGFALGNSAYFGWSSTANGAATVDTFMTRKGAANVQLGNMDAASPVAQTLSAQSVVTGTSNTAGANLTIKGSAGTGTGVGGTIIFQTAVTGSTGSTPNTYSNVLTIGDPNGTATQLTINSGSDNAGITFANAGSARIRMRQGGGQLVIDSAGLFRGMQINPTPDASGANGLSMTSTWNTGGTVLREFVMNVTNTASAAGSKLLDLQVSSSTVFNVEPSGNTYIGGTLDLGATSDTTISRSSAGVIAVEGVVIPSISSTNTLTNKFITPQVQSVADAGGTLTPVAITNDIVIATALSQATTIAAPTGSPVQGEKLIIRLKDDGTARALTWDAIYRAIGVTLPTTTVISKTVYVGFIYNSTDTKWDAVAVAQEA